MVPLDVLPLLSIDNLVIKNEVTWLDDWFPLSALAIMVVIIIHVAFLMIARAFSIKEFENYAKSELLQALASAVMVGSLLIMVNSALDLAHGYIAGEVACAGQSINIGTTNDSTMDEAFDAMRCRIQEKANKVGEIQAEVTTGAGTWAEFNLINLQASALGITFLKGDWLNDLYRKTETTRITNNLATVMLIGLNAQSAVLAYMKANMLDMFVPLGLLLRSFYFTRGLGALFISMGIGFYFIFPIFFILLDPGFTPAPPAPPSADSVIPENPYCYATMSSTVSVLQTLQAGGLGTTGLLQAEEVRTELSKSYIQLMLHPLVAFFLTMVFVRYMMTVLGSDAYELMRMTSKVI
ncbi:MAG: hypothetical protein AB1324_07920 [Candidatus Micrarchaeota archaeon]